MITVGNLDTPVQIQSNTFTVNPNYGSIQDETWAAASSINMVWAHMLFKGGNERDEGEQKVGEQKVEFFIRYETYKDLIQQNWRVKHTLSDGTFSYYYIEGISQIDGRHKMTKLITIKKDSE
jgi:head-tail adaptor